MKKNIAVKLTNVSKKYIIHHEKPTLVERILNGKEKEFFALKNINLNIEKGDRVGIIGDNGSGKTTLLKLITKIASPTTGSIETNGKIVSLIDLEAGFHPDLNGIRNIYLNGTIVGMSKKEIDSKINDIINFANIGSFIYAPLFTYSSGMALRLGFAIAIHANPDVLVLDEGFAVGDIQFRAACYKKINKMIKAGKTFITASHDIMFVKNNCNRVVWVKDGQLHQDGKPNLILKKYIKESTKPARQKNSDN